MCFPGREKPAGVPVIVPVMVVLTTQLLENSRPLQWSEQFKTDVSSVFCFTHVSLISFLFKTAASLEFEISMVHVTGTWTLKRVRCLLRGVEISTPRIWNWSWQQIAGGCRFRDMAIWLQNDWIPRFHMLEYSANAPKIDDSLQLYMCYVPRHGRAGFLTWTFSTFTLAHPARWTRHPTHTWTWHQMRECSSFISMWLQKNR